MQVLPLQVCHQGHHLGFAVAKFPYDGINIFIGQQFMGFKPAVSVYQFVSVSGLPSAPASIV
jgi:hypothetical protein